MRENFVYAALVLVVCGGVYLVTQGMNLMNQPSDMKVAGGVALIVLVLISIPGSYEMDLAPQDDATQPTESIGEKK